MTREEFLNALPHVRAEFAWHVHPDGRIRGIRRARTLSAPYSVGTAVLWSRTYNPAQSWHQAARLQVLPDAAQALDCAANREAGHTPALRQALLDGLGLSEGVSPADYRPAAVF